MSRLIDLGSSPPYIFLQQIIQLSRPREWAKSIFVLAPLLFSESVVQRDALVSAGIAVGCFCLWSSAVYCLNDLIDMHADRQHPRKRNRPVASGRVTPAFALILSAALASVASAIALWMLPIAFTLFGTAYLINGISYCLFLKYRVIVDVLSIAGGFVLRLAAGCVAISVQPSSWILVCGFSLALLLGFGKRRLEVAQHQPTQYRAALQSYSAEKLNLLLAIAAAICLLAYMLYTVSPETVRLHGSDRLVYTVPFVAYGVFRYLFKVQEGRHDGPVELLFADRIFVWNGFLWAVTVVIILYYF